MSAWISGRFDATATLFTLVSVLGFLRSQRRLDAAWWYSLAALVAACLCKESAAIVPCAIVLVAVARESSDAPAPRKLVRAVIAAMPWIAVAIGYLALRAAIFGSPFVVYGGVDPAQNMMSAAYWHALGHAIPTFLRAQFQPSSLYIPLAVLTALQVAACALTPGQRSARRIAWAALGTASIAVALVLPHTRYLPPTGLGGRLLYQGWAFYAIFVGVVLASSHRAYAAWALSLLVAGFHGLFHHDAISRWETGFRDMRALVAGVRDIGRETPSSRYALVLVPGGIGAVPFARNAQAGLMVPPIQPADLSRQVLVQLYDELPDLPAKLRDGVVPTLKREGLRAYAAGRRLQDPGLLYPTDVYCWTDGALRPVPLAGIDSRSPDAWVASLRPLLDGAGCRQGD